MPSPFLYMLTEFCVLTLAECPVGQIFSECSGSCPHICEDLWPHTQCIEGPCVPGCTCPDRRVRMWTFFMKETFLNFCFFLLFNYLIIAPAGAVWWFLCAPCWVPVFTAVPAGWLPKQQYGRDDGSAVPTWNNSPAPLQHMVIYCFILHTVFLFYILSGKSRTLSIVKGKVVDKRFVGNYEVVRTVLEKPEKSLGRWYDANPSNDALFVALRQKTSQGVGNIEKLGLPGKSKLCFLQFGLFPRLMWSLTVYEVPLSEVEKIEKMINSFVRKWLRVPRCLSSAAWYGKAILELPISNLTEEFKCSLGQARLSMTLTQSKVPVLKLVANSLLGLPELSWA